jgi:hypothetical protein
MPVTKPRPAPTVRRLTVIVMMAVCVDHDHARDPLVGRPRAARLPSPQVEISPPRPRRRFIPILPLIRGTIRPSRLLLLLCRLCRPSIPNGNPSCPPLLLLPLRLCRLRMYPPIKHPIFPLHRYIVPTCQRREHPYRFPPGSQTKRMRRWDPSSDRTHS